MTRLLTPAVLGGVEVTPLGLGTARLGAFWQRRSPKAGLEAVRTALDLGVTLIDTADVYARGIAERIVGHAIRGRDDVVVMTKVGLLKTPAGFLAAARSGGGAFGIAGLAQGGVADTCFHPEYVETAARRCLHRQGRETLDVLLLHEPNPEVLHSAPFGEAMERLVQRGEIISWGASVRTLDAALAALDLPGLTWLQIPANLMAGETAKAVSRHPRSKDVVTVALAALGDGSLLPAASRSGLHGADAAAALVEGAAALPGIDAVLLGMSCKKHVVENLGAVQRGVATDDIERVATAVHETEEER